MYGGASESSSTTSDNNTNKKWNITLAKETEWIRVKHKTKKRKKNTTSSPTTPTKFQEKTAKQKAQIIDLKN